jgi:hypothetical protein
MVSFGFFAPDAMDDNPNASDRIVNCVPTGDGYRPFKKPVPVSEALPSKPIGVHQAINPAGQTALYVSTVDAFYVLNTDTSPYSFDEVTKTSLRPLGLDSTEYVGFLTFGNKVIATNKTINTQVIDMVAGGNSDDLGGSPPRALFGADFMNRVWLFNLEDKVNALRFSGIELSEYWELAKKGSDINLFKSGGAINGSIIVGNEMYVIQQRAIRKAVRNQYTQVAFTDVSTFLGCRDPRNTVSVFGAGYFFLM